MFSSAEVMDIAMEQLAIECNCSPTDFGKKENVITTSVLSNKRRRFIDKPFFFRMTTMGGNAVISADVCLHEWLAGFVRGKAGHGLFEHTNLREIDKQLESFGRQLYQTHHMFLPLRDAKPQEATIQVKWVEGDDIHQFYDGKRFPNALCEKYMPERPDMLAVAAMHGLEIMGMAGCSADTQLLWQIGIDVHESYRGKGIGSQLVSLMRDEIIARGKIPYYGTSLSNIQSQRIALNCGFCPVWIDTESIE